MDSFSEFELEFVEIRLLTHTTRSFPEEFLTHTHRKLHRQLGKKAETNAKGEIGTICLRSLTSMLSFPAFTEKKRGKNITAFLYLDFFREMTFLFKGLFS